MIDGTTPREVDHKADRLQNQKSRASPSLIMLHVLVIGFIASIIALAQDPFWPTLESLFIPSIFVCIISIWGFFVSGGRTINASSTASFGVLIFGGFSGAYTALGLNPAADSTLGPSLLFAIVFLFVFQLLLTGSQYWLHLNCEPSRSKESAPRTSPARFTLGCGLFVAGLATTMIGVSTAGASLAILGIFLVADCSYRSRRIGLATIGSLILLAMCWVYWEYIFEGFGRLVIAVIGCGVVAFAALYFRHFGIKIALLIGALIGLPVLAAQRIEFLEESRGSTPAGSEGIGSVVEPIIGFSRVIQASLSARLDPSWGSTYLDAITLWIPREFWPAKPQGFGADMVPITQPYRVSTAGFSDAALFGGELVWNFGAIGAICALPILIFLITRLDRLFDSDSFADGGRSGTFYRVAVVATSASVLNFVWAGSNLFVGRLQVMLVCLALLWLAARYSERDSVPSLPKQ